MDYNILRDVVIKTIKPNPLATCRLFCFPFAGGSASVYKDWGNLLHPNIEVCAVQMPGRESRMFEDPYFDIESVVEEVVSVINSFDDKPYAFFGHSLGALICFEVTRKLFKKNEKKPRVIFLSACDEPKLEPKEKIHHLPKDEFIEKIEELGGTPKLILENEELMELFEPVLRGDFTMIEAYKYKEDDPIDCKFVVYGGSDDEYVDFDKLSDWRNYTTSDFDLYKIEGGHFFLKESIDELLKNIKKHLKDQSLIN